MTAESTLSKIKKHTCFLKMRRYSISTRRSPSLTTRSLKQPGTLKTWSRSRSPRFPTTRRWRAPAVLIWKWIRLPSSSRCQLLANGPSSSTRRCCSPKGANRLRIAASRWRLAINGAFKTACRTLRTTARLTSTTAAVKVNWRRRGLPSAAHKCKLSAR